MFLMPRAASRSKVSNRAVRSRDSAHWLIAQRQEFGKPSGSNPCPPPASQDLKITPEVNIDAPDRSVVRVIVNCAGATGADSIESVALDGSREIAHSTGMPGAELTLSIPRPKLWSPDRPFLYDLKVSLHHPGQADDVVQSYFGMRKIALGKDDKGVLRILLNGQFVFQIGPLDQGFWPDGIYTAPSDEALRYDIEMTKKLGFNATRKHIKIEPDRWYYWCDRLGLLVWQDMPSGGGQTSPAAARQFELEMKRMIENHVNHPAIVMWILFNEEWGEYDPVRLTDIVRSFDPTRLVNTVSCGNTHGAGDIIDDHPYWIPRAPKEDGKRAVVIGEFGGRAMALPGHVVSVEKAFGHPGGTVLASPWELTAHYLKLVREVYGEREKSGLNGAICTQLTDIEEECNGFMTYDREVVKVDLDQVAAANRGHLPPVKQFRSLSPTAQDAAGDLALIRSPTPESIGRNRISTIRHGRMAPADSVWETGTRNGRRPTSGYAGSSRSIRGVSTRRSYWPTMIATWISFSTACWPRRSADTPSSIKNSRFGPKLGRR